MKFKVCVINELLEIKRLLNQIIQREKAMSAELDALTVQVEATRGIEESAIQLINGIAAQLAAIKDDPAKIQALADSLKAESDALAAAVAANQPPA
jgi:hypothetical protein